jgi:hypothetical protein
MSSLPLFAAADHVDDQRLLGPGEELLVVTVGKVLLEVGGGMEVDTLATGDTNDKDVLLVGNAALAIVDDLAVAIEGEAVFDVAADVKDGYGFLGRSVSSQALGQGTGGVGTVEEMDDALSGVDLGNNEERANPIEEEHEHDNNARGDEAKPSDAKSFDYDEDEGSSAGGGEEGDEHCSGRGHGCAVGYEPGKEQGKDGHDATEDSMGEEEPAVEAGAAAEEEVSGEDGERRNGGEDVSGELGLRNREEDDGDESPEDEELRKGVAGSLGRGASFGNAAQAPLSN